MCSTVLHSHISSASSLWTSAFLNACVSVPYDAMLHMNAFITLFFSTFFSTSCNFPSGCVFLSLNAALAVVILVLTSCSQRQSSVRPIMLSRFRNCLTCSISSPLFTIFTYLFPFLWPLIFFVFFVLIFILYSSGSLDFEIKVCNPFAVLDSIALLF